MRIKNHLQINTTNQMAQEMAWMEIKTLNIFHPKIKSAASLKRLNASSHATLFPKWNRLTVQNANWNEIVNLFELCHSFFDIDSTMKRKLRCFQIKHDFFQNRKSFSFTKATLRTFRFEREKKYLFGTKKNGLEKKNDLEHKKTVWRKKKRFGTKKTRRHRIEYKTEFYLFLRCANSKDSLSVCLHKVEKKTTTMTKKAANFVCLNHWTLQTCADETWLN